MRHVHVTRLHLHIHKHASDFGDEWLGGLQVLCYPVEEKMQWPISQGLVECVGNDHNITNSR